VNTCAFVAHLLKSQNVLLWHEHRVETFAPLISWDVDDALSEAISRHQSRRCYSLPMSFTFVW